MIKISRCRIKNGKLTYKYLPGYLNVFCESPKSSYGSLNPRAMTLDGKNLMNVWNFHKLYSWVPDTRVYKNGVLVFEHQSAELIKRGELTLDYYKWRSSGVNFEGYLDVHYPASKCLGTYWDDEVLSSISARKKVAFPTYMSCLQNNTAFANLYKLHKKGVNLLIHDFAGPDEQLMPDYIISNHVQLDFIKNDIVTADAYSLKILANNKKTQFGHSYYLAMALSGLDQRDISFFNS